MKLFPKAEFVLEVSAPVEAVRERLRENMQPKCPKPMDWKPKAFGGKEMKGNFELRYPNNAAARVWFEQDGEGRTTVFVKMRMVWWWWVYQAAMMPLALTWFTWSNAVSSTRSDREKVVGYVVYAIIAIFWLSEWIQCRGRLKMFYSKLQEVLHEAAAAKAV